MSCGCNDDEGGCILLCLGLGVVGAIATFLVSKFAFGLPTVVAGKYAFYAICIALLPFGGAWMM